MHLPKVLVVAPIKFNHETGSGVTSGNFFRGWPSQSIAQIHSDPHTAPDLTVCDKYFFFPKSLNSDSGRLPSPVKKLVQIFGLVSSLQSVFARQAPWKTALQWAEQFSPDILFARPTESPVFYTWLCRQMAVRLKIPYVTCIFDDWVSRPDNGRHSAVTFLLRSYLRKEFKLLLKGSSANLVISKEMSEAYEKKYACSFSVFRNCIDFSQWISINKCYKSNGSFSIVYAGAVTQDKELGSLIDIKDVVVSLADAGLPVHLTVYGPSLWEKNIREHIVRPPHVIYGGYFAPEQKPQIFSRADLLVLPINFDRPSLAYVGFSFQTKLPEYMASGTPILIYAPPTSPNVRYAVREAFAEVVDRPDKDMLRSAILEIIQSEEKRVRLGERAKKLVFTEHNAETTRKRFRDLLVKVSKSKPKQAVTET